VKLEGKFEENCWRMKGKEPKIIETIIIAMKID
jgi:hypothetical protein